ncbi:MAG: MotA/TolQ/ExbB proton channel family protein [Planctomycetota bacterium]
MPTRDTQELTATAGSSELQRAEQRARRRQRSGTIVGTAAGLAATLVFYVVAPLAAKPFAGGTEFVNRYFCGHPLEYITSAMFFVGMGILAMKFRRLPAERRAVQAMNEIAISGSWKVMKGAADDILQAIEEWQAAALSKGWRSTFLSNRLDEVLHYATHRKSGSFEDHLRYLADLANDRLLQSYSLVRTVTWAVPIMGFLGTVIGITMAIANVTPEQLDTSLPEVTAGLAVAFDTTAQALGMSMILVFGTFLVERGELGLLSDVEQFGIEHLVPVLSGDDESAALKTGVPAISDWTAHVLSQQTEFWNRHLTTLQSGWAESLQMQTSRLSTLLTQETENTLQAHRDSVNLTRDTYASALQGSTDQFAQRMESMLLAFVNRVDHWQNALQTTSISAAGQAEELHRLGRILLQLTESEQRLVQLQETLDRNLQAVQLIETLERTIASLNAAVSILAAKTTFRSAA